VCGLGWLHERFEYSGRWLPPPKTTDESVAGQFEVLG
jgi:hypothetical protein